MKTSLAVAAAATVLSLAPPARAVDPFEIQVYEGDINRPLQPGLELHLNFVPVGRTTRASAGEVAPDKVFRSTLEPSFGILEWWELGAYLQFAAETKDPAAHWAGFKLRSKQIVPRRLTGHFALGLNVEVGRGTSRFGGTDWDTELRPIVAYHAGRWSLAVNPMFGWALSGDTSAVPDFEPNGKARFDTGYGFGVGVEYYAGFGRLSDVPGVSGQEHVAYAIADLIGAPFELNVGVGRGLTEVNDDLVTKAILGFAF